MMKMKSVFLGLLTGAFFIGAAVAQTGQLGSGQVWGNPNAGQQVAQPSSVTSILDRALGNTRGSIIERGISGWAIIGPSATAGLPWVSNGAGADPAYQILQAGGGGTGNAFFTVMGPATAIKTYTFPNVNATMAALGVIQTWTAAQSYSDGTLVLLGSASGSTTLKAPAAGGGTATLFAASDTVVGKATTDTFTNKTFDTAGTGNSFSIAGVLVTANTGTGAMVRAANPTFSGTVGGAATIPNSVLVNSSITINGTGISLGSSGTVTAAAGTLTGSALNAAVTGSSLTGVGTLTSGALGSGFTAVGIAQGGTGQTTASTARSSSGLNIDQFTGRGDANYSILNTDRTVGTNAAFTASRTWTLPAANSVFGGYEVLVADFQGTVTASNTLVISRGGSDTINGGTTVTITAANGAYLLKSDGISKWTAQAMGAATGGGVTSVTCGSFTVTTSGTCDAPTFAAYKATDQSVATTADTIINADTKEYDTKNWYNTSTFRYTPLLAGKYRITVQVFGGAASSLTRVDARIYKNGSSYAYAQCGTSTATFGSCSITKTVSMNGSTDYIEGHGLVAGTTPVFSSGTSPFLTFIEGAFVTP